MKAKYDVMETANQAGKFGVFIEAIETAGFTEALKEPGPYTILAPVDEAFKRMPKANREKLFSSENRESLQSLLRHHIVPGALLTSDLMRRDGMRSIKGDELRIESRVGLWVNEAQVIRPDLKASNGVVHGIDAVLLPQTESATV